MTELAGFITSALFWGAILYWLYRKQKGDKD